MRLVTYNSQNLYLLDEQPDWATPFRARATLLSVVEAGLTDREGRRALGDTLRLRVEYQIKAAGLESRALAAALRAHRNEPVAVPFWPAACRWADRATADLTGGLNYLVNANWATLGQRTNLAFHSNAFTETVWEEQGADVFANAATDPDGAMVATLMRERTDINAGCRTGQWIAKPAVALDYTCSVFVKKKDKRYVALRLDDAFYLAVPRIDLDAGTIDPYYDPSARGRNHTIAPVGGGWFRVAVTFATGAANAMRLTVEHLDAGGGTDNFTGDGVSGTYICRAQIEAGALLTPYIETGAAAVSSAESTVFESTPPPWASADDILTPLVVGNLDARELSWPSDEYATLDVALTENSPAAWAISPAAYAAPAGPQPAAYDVAPRLFPFLTHWDAPRTTFTLRIEREQIGFGRESSDTLRANSAVARTVEQVAWASRADGWSAAKLLRFFADHGAGTSFWACAQHGAARLAADVGANAAAATVDNASGISAGDYLGLVQRGQLVGAFGPIAIAGLALTFPASGCPACPAALTSLSPLILARFEKPELSLTWTTDGFATAAFRVRELPPEIVPPVNETLGLYIGELARRAWLYEFARDYAGTVVTERVTSYESALEYEGETYAPARISHGEMRQGLALDRDELALDADGLDVVAIRDLISQRLEVPLVLTVIAAEVTGPGLAENGDVKFTGEVVSGRLRARRVTAKAAPGGSRLDRKHPRFFLQAGCNHNLFSAGCGLASAAWVHTAVMADPGAAGYPFTFALSGLARAGGPILTGADSFAGGWLEVGAGATLQRLPIQASSIVSGDTVTLTLSRDPAPWIAAATAVRIFPGCDGRKETCAGRFNNFLNFGGHPFVPANNPTLKTISASGGGKK